MRLTAADRCAHGCAWRNSADQHSSCGAASAATLLHTVGILATEPEMTTFCLTRKEGTSMRGVYRGLVIATEGSPWRVGVLTGGLDDLRRTVTAHGPVRISVGLPRIHLQPVDPRYEAEWGWEPGQRHAVVLFGFLPGG